MQIDIIENDLYNIEPQVLKILLKDKTTGKKYYMGNRCICVLWYRIWIR